MRHRLRLAGLALAGAALAAGCTSQAEAGPPATPRPPAPQSTTTPQPTTTAPTTTVAETPPPCAPDVRACVSLSMRQAWLMTNGVVDYGPIPITHGGTTNPTPTGTWPVAWKDQEHTSSIYGTPMPYSVFFAPGGIAFHEGRIDEDSHGCVRMAMESAAIFFSSLETGQPVQVVA